jgi:dihydrofolate synthase / folylpolyglutamate synthase
MQTDIAFQAILEYLYGLKRFGIRLGLENISCLLSRLGYPQKTVRTIHVGGTNGKGSTAALIQSILMAKGYCVGLYTSPHLQSVRERIQINRIDIPQDEFIILFETIKDIIESEKKEITFFEFLTAMALKYFCDQRADLAVIEVGMGGRFDATNIINPEVSVITNIDYEHTEYLGKELKEIAFEKAGIIKNEGTLVTGVRQQEVLALMQDICDSRDAGICSLDNDFKVTVEKMEMTKTRFRFQDRRKVFGNLEIPLAGRHQVDNAALAVKTSLMLAERGFDIGEEEIRNGLKNVNLKGRFEIVKRNPMVICDGAHNPAGIKSFMESLLQLVSFDRLFVVFGAMSDKDLSQMGEPFASHADTIILVKPGVERAVDPELILNQFKKHKQEIIIIRDVDAAINQALFRAGKKDVICIIGSLYLVAEALQFLDPVSVTSC